MGGVQVNVSVVYTFSVNRSMDMHPMLIEGDRQRANYNVFLSHDQCA